MKISFRWLAALGGLALFAGCVDPITVGSELLEQDRADVGFTDTLKLEGITETADPLLFYNANSSQQPNSNYLFGAIKDDIFGLNRASLYLVPRLQRNSIFQVVRPAFAGRPDVVLDSIVLVLPTDSTAAYGVKDAPYPWKVTALGNRIDAGENHQTDEEFTLNLVTDSQGTFRPNGDSLLVSPLNVTALGDSVSRPHVRLPLSLDLGRRILDRDSSIYNSDTIFQLALPGLYLEPDGETPGIADFDFGSTWAGLHVYYTLGGVPGVYVFPISPITRINPVINRYQQDFTGSYVAEFLNDVTADSLIFVEGMGGLRTRLELPDLREIRGQIVNKAELEFTVRRFEGVDYTVFPEPQSLALMYPDEEGELQFVDDILFSLNGSVGAFFGGLLREDPATGNLIYQMNISVHLQRIIEGEYPPVLYLVAEPRLGNPRRTALFGPSSTRHPVRLKVAFTKL